MKKKRIWVALSVVGLIALSIYFCMCFTMSVSSSFATEVLLEYHYFDKDISVRITDEYDIQTLREILKGRPFKDSPSCGFTTDISITMTDGSKSIIFCPANDSCPLLRVNSSGKYIQITGEDKMRLYDVLEKYGLTFPCV